MQPYESSDIGMYELERERKNRESWDTVERAQKIVKLFRELTEKAHNAYCKVNIAEDIEQIRIVCHRDCELRV
jgi:hypothetical protein